jgi:hypothetical protein
MPDLATDRLCFLTIDKALADLASFIDLIKYHEKTDLNIEIFIVGKFYPGSLSS